MRAAPAWNRRLDLQRFAGERTLPATPRQRQKARERGQVARSAELSAAAGFLSASAVLAVGARLGVPGFAGWAAGAWAAPAPASLDIHGAMDLLTGGTWAFARLAGPPLCAAALGTLAVGIAQTGFVLSLRPLAPDLGRLSPLEGLRRVFSRRALVELAKALVKLGALCALVWAPSAHLVRSLLSATADPSGVAQLTYQATEAVLVRGGLLLAAVGAADYFYQRYEMDASLRMTREEVRQELRESEGDPALRARRRRRQRELARRRMLVDVRRADVVVANPTHFAVALRYDSRTMSAPVVVAKGVDFMAERIKTVARAADVLIIENPPLARSLHAATKVGQHVPAALYKAVAEVLAYVWRVRGRAP